jgi:MFS family permease
MSFIPSFERTAKSSTISHSLLVLGYKLFSFYFPLFLLEKGLSLPQIGLVYFLIYLPIAILSPLIGAISRKINPYLLVISGILGYSLYSLGMLFLPSSLFFYILQVILGISTSFFLIGNRVVLMSSRLSRAARSFGLFHSISYYAAEFAPAIGAGIIFLCGFSGVFILSILIHTVNILYTYFSVRKSLNIQLDIDSYASSLSHFGQVIKNSFNSDILPVLIFSLAILTLGGFYQSFFLIFLKSIGWGMTQILLYSSLSSIVFLPLSLFGIRAISNFNAIKIIFTAGIVFAISSIAIGSIAPLVGFLGILILMLIAQLGSFLTNSSRLRFITRVFSSFPHGVTVLDTILSPLSVALGSLFGGLLLIEHIGYSGIFISGGILIIFLSLFIKIFHPLTEENKV